MWFDRLMMGMPGAISLGFLWGVMTLGIYMTFRMLDFADMTVDGSFALGGAVVARLITGGLDPFVSTFVSFCIGMLAGACTGLMTTKLRIPGLLAGILTNISLYSINLRIMGKANIPIPSVIENGQKTFATIFARLPSFGLSEKMVILLYGGLIVFALVFLLWWFLNTEIGITIRSTGDNPKMSRALGVNTDRMTVLCLMIANGLVGMSGALIAQNNKFASVDMGVGAIVFGLASVIIGEVLFRRRSLLGLLVCTVLGSVVYRIIQSVVLSFDVFAAEDFKLITALIVVFALALPLMSEKMDKLFKKMGWRKGETYESVEEPAMTAPSEAGATPDALVSLETQDTSLTVSNISKTFNQGTVNQKNALVDVELTLEPGDFVTVIGGNGAGKSTLLNTVAGVYPVDGGGIVIGTSTVTSEPEYKRARLIGRVFQDPMTGTAAGMTIEENLSIAMKRGKRRTLRQALRKEDRAKYQEMLSTLGLGLEKRMRSRVGLLSGGQRQALTLLMATAVRPRLLLLDEHTAALDPKTARNVLTLTQRLIGENHLTALMVTHNMKDALQYGNRTIMMHEGKIIIDIESATKKRIKVEDLLAMFEQASGDAIVSDRMLLSK